MAASPAQPIGNPADLELPSNLASLLDLLPVSTHGRVASDLLTALEAARRTGDLHMLQSTVWRWRHLARLADDPNFQQAIAWAASHHPHAEDGMTLDQFQGRFLAGRATSTGSS